MRGVKAVKPVTDHENRAIPSETSEVEVVRIPDTYRQVPDKHGTQACGYTADVRADPEVQGSIRCRASTAEQCESCEIGGPKHEMPGRENIVVSSSCESGRLHVRRKEETDSIK